MMHLEKVRSTVIAATTVFCLCLGIESARAEEKVANTVCPFVIQPELGASEFAPGDGIVIASLRGDREHLETGGNYMLDGSYTLASAENADLAWFATSHGPSGSTPVTDTEHIQIARGSGDFHLEKKLLGDGWLHVSFYVNGRASGGIYFGEKGFKESVLWKKSWSDFSEAQTGELKGQGTAGANSAKTTEPIPANVAIMAYLGEPVPLPVAMDERFSPVNLKAAFISLSKKLGLKVVRLDIDESEFPYVIYGLLDGQCDHRALASAVRQLNGYGYGGSVSGSTPEGGTYFAMNMIPVSQYPQGRSNECERRLMVRLQMFAEAAHSAKPELASSGAATNSSGSAKK
jgi:hypothetical protein